MQKKSKKIIEQILSLKEVLKDKVIIPAHHYTNDEIVELADFVGDSYKLAVKCTKTNSDYIVFCGVKFMAEGAATLAPSNQKVLIPNLGSGCPLADKLDSNSIRKSYSQISKIITKEVIPIVYVNSNIEVKSFCGAKNGSTCTSSNAKKIVNYYLKKDKVVLFAPDYNLGINTADQLNLPQSEVVKVKRDFVLVANGPFNRAKMFIWDGFCYVHKKFKVNDIKILKEKYPHIKIIVHPESDRKIIQLSDKSGSTQEILTTVKNSPVGSIWGVGTERHFVERMDKNFKDKTVIPLTSSSCADMGKNTLFHLKDSLESIINYEKDKKKLKYEIIIPYDIKQNAKLALEKMIKIVEER